MGQYLISIVFLLFSCGFLSCESHRETSVKNKEIDNIEPTFAQQGEECFLHGYYGNALLYFQKINLCDTTSLNYPTLNFYLRSLIYLNSTPDSINLLAECIATRFEHHALPVDYYIYKGDESKALEILSRGIVPPKDFNPSNSGNNDYVEISILKNEINDIKHTMQLMGIVGFSLILAVCLSYVIWSYIRRRTNSEDSIGLQLTGQGETIYIRNDNKKNGKNDERHNHIFRHTIERIDSICKEYYRHPAPEKNATHVHWLKSEIDKIKTLQNNLESIEDEINRETDGLLEEVYGKMRKLTFKQRNLVWMLYYKVSTETICQILDIEPSAFYNRKSRLIDSLEKSKSPKKTELIGMF